MCTHQLHISFGILKFVENNQNIGLMSKHMTIEEKDGRVRVEMSARKWREYERLMATYQLARKIARANRQADKAPVHTLEEAEEIINNL